MELLIALAIGLAIALAPRPAPLETVTVLRSADGHVGAVLVEHAGEQRLLNEANATSRTRAGEKIQVARLSDEEVRRSYASVLSALPARPASFLLYFVTGTDELTDDSKRELQKILEEIKHRPYPDIQVIGHTDTVGELEGNDRLSAQRAERMKAYLTAIGVPESRITVTGRGEREPLVHTGDNVDELKNRRVEINVR